VPRSAALEERERQGEGEGEKGRERQAPRSAQNILPWVVRCFTDAIFKLMFNCFGSSSLTWPSKLLTWSRDFQIQIAFDLLYLIFRHNCIHIALIDCVLFSNTEINT
jgi:hypothetical protein